MKNQKVGRKNELNSNQLNDVFEYVRSVGKVTKRIDIPQQAEKFVVDAGLFDSLFVWVMNGWPIAAFDQMDSTYWAIE
ncbi:hypothetical protein C9426_23885 [Serratia sp. S1B]|nr:hypothetical protein C9426_23885 [Serratia sp. S1B]